MESKPYITEVHQSILYMPQGFTQLHRTSATELNGSENITVTAINWLITVFGGVAHEMHVDDDDDDEILVFTIYQIWKLRGDARK